MTIDKQVANIYDRTGSLLDPDNAQFVQLANSLSFADEFNHFDNEFSGKAILLDPYMNGVFYGCESFRNLLRDAVKGGLDNVILTQPYNLGRVNQIYYASLEPRPIHVNALRLHHSPYTYGTTNLWRLIALSTYGVLYLDSARENGWSIHT